LEKPDEHQQHIALNPFSLMMEPELVLQTMERSEQLRRLRRHKLRPLDKPPDPVHPRSAGQRAPPLMQPSMPKNWTLSATICC